MNNYKTLFRHLSLRWRSFFGQDRGYSLIMKPYINDLLELINHEVSNTYKMSWIKSIVEICEQHCKKEIHFDELSPIIFKYY